MSRRYSGVLLAVVLFIPLAAQSARFTRVDDAKLAERFGQFRKKNAERLESLAQLFKAAGCTGEHLTRQKVKGSKLPNLVCLLPGETGETIVVGAHYDFVSAGGTGSVDNWSGASLLPSLYESLSQEKRRYTFLFVGFTDEEKGLVGARAIARQIRKHEMAPPRAVVNIDCIGMTPTKLWVSHSDMQLVRLALAVARALDLPVSGMNADKVGSSDAAAFGDLKIPVLDVHSVTTETLPMIHSARDVTAALNLKHYSETYRLVAGVLVTLDAQPASSAGAQTSGSVP